MGELVLEAFLELCHRFSFWDGGWHGIAGLAGRGTCFCNGLCNPPTLDAVVLWPTTMAPTALVLPTATNNGLRNLLMLGAWF